MGLIKTGIQGAFLLGATKIITQTIEKKDQKKYESRRRDETYYGRPETQQGYQQRLYLGPQQQYNNFRETEPLPPYLRSNTYNKAMDKGGDAYLVKA